MKGTVACKYARTRYGLDVTSDKNDEVSPIIIIIGAIIWNKQHVVGNNDINCY